MPWPKGKPHTEEERKHISMLQRGRKRNNGLRGYKATASARQNMCLAQQKRRGSLSLRFWTRVRITASCWEWTGHVLGPGIKQYGRIRVGKKNIFAHRMAWELLFGPIPDGLLVLHRCDNPRCVRGDHLYLGTHDDNSHDKITRGRQRIVPQRGSTNGAAKLREDDIPIIRKLLEAGFQLDEVAELFDVSFSLIGMIKRGEIWTHII